MNGLTGPEETVARYEREAHVRGKPVPEWIQRLKADNAHLRALDEAEAQRQEAQRQTDIGQIKELCKRLCELVERLPHDR